MTDEELRPMIMRECHIELARRSLYGYATLMRPTFYKLDRKYLRFICDTIDWFLFEQSKKKFLLLSVPPRFGKTLTIQSASEYVFGRRPETKIMTGSYNKTLSTIFSVGVRDTIGEINYNPKRVTFRDIFPEVKLKAGQTASNVWALENQPNKSYLATSPDSTATGIGANLMIIDDIVKNAVEALNERALEDHWLWFTNTMMQRLEGDWKVIVIMTRWSINDLAGRILNSYGDQVVNVCLPVKNEKGEMLCPEILDEAGYRLKTQEMLKPIAEANYMQKPLDIEGQLYPTLLTYRPSEMSATDDDRVLAIIDTADTGNDYLCAIIYRFIEGMAYVVDVLFTQEDMDITESKLGNMLYANNVTTAIFEANNGGRLFSKNIERYVYGTFSNPRLVVESHPQTKNKEARILTSSAWVKRHVLMPVGWHAKWPEFYANVIKYQAKGKNEHDDAPDVLASIFERHTGRSEPKVKSKAELGLA